MLRSSLVLAQAASGTRASARAAVRLLRAPRAAQLASAKAFLSGAESAVLVRGFSSKSLGTDRDPSKVGAGFYSQPRVEVAAASASPAPASKDGRSKVRQVLRAAEPGDTVTVKGWVRSVRDQKAFSFIEVNDGSCLTNLQVVAIKEKLANYDEILEKLTTGASLSVTGAVVASTGKNQRVEVQAEKVEVVGECDGATYPLQKKRHTLEFLRGIAHLRPRTNTISAVMRVRNTLAYAVHQYFQERGFVYVHTPIITASDCEGAGAMFGVSTLVAPDEQGRPARHEKMPRTKEGTLDFSKDFFEKPAFLTVSGQLNAEMYACALSDVYTFGPTFRAENSNTARHLAEFWMIEPEMAFADLAADADCAEGFIRFAIGQVLEKNAEDVALFDSFVEKGLRERLERLASRPFARITYTEAIERLQARKLKEGEKLFEFPVEWGMDLQSEHERWLTEVAFDGTPVIVMNYPKDIKAFYMRMNDDGKTVAAMDILVPKIGELVGGSQREERTEQLLQRLRDCGLPEEEYGPYLDLRRFGSVPHAGFGVGFERLVLCATGMENIRDVIPFPRTPGNALF